MNLNEKLRVWQEKGFIDEQAADLITQFEQRQPQKPKMPLLLTIGLIFFVLAVFSFIAANWQVMPAILKIGLALFVMWLFYIVAIIVEKKDFGNPTIFRVIGLAMFGAIIIIIAQTFHFSLSSTVLPWSVFIAALLHHLIWRDKPYAVISFLAGIGILFTAFDTISLIEWVLFVLITLGWYIISTSYLSTKYSWLLLFGAGLSMYSLFAYKSSLWPIWTIFVLYSLCFIFPKKELIIRHLMVGISSIVFLVYLTFRGETSFSLVQLNMLESIALLLVAITLALMSWSKFPSILWVLSLGIVGVLLFDETAIGLTIVAEMIALAYLVHHHRKHQKLSAAFTFFIAVQAVVYFLYAWERLDVSLFFLIGAILLFGLSAIAWFLNRKKAGESV